MQDLILPAPVSGGILLNPDAMQAAFITGTEVVPETPDTFSGFNNNKMVHLKRDIFIFLLLFPGLWIQRGEATGSVPEEVRALRTVVIDPGHGGHDPGAVSGGVREKDIVLDLAIRLGEKIRKVHPEVRVIFTRDKDVFIPLFQRTAMANHSKADLFISLHANYVSSPGVAGTETFTLGLHSSQENLAVAKKENSVILLEKDYGTNYEGFNPQEAESYIMFENLQSEYQSQSIDFAAHIQNQFRNRLNTANRGVKQAGFLVLRQAGMPSVLVEVGFISNPNERKFLTSESGKEKVAESIFQAFCTYKKTIDERSRFNLAASVQLPDTATPAVNTGVPDSGREESPAPAPRPGENPKLPAEKEPVPPPPAGEMAAGNNAAKSPMNSPPAKKTEPTETREARWYAVQVAATQRVVEITSANFKGETNITRIQVGNLNKYLAGRFSSFGAAVKERERLKTKFPDAFVVVVDKGIPVAAKN